MSHRIENKTNILFSFNALFRVLKLYSIFNLYKQKRFKINIQINIKEYLSILDDKFTTPAIPPAVLKEYLSVYKMDLDSDLDKISFPKEVNFYNGRTILDQVVNNGVTKIANEWKKKESDVKWHQIISEIHGFKKEYGRGYSRNKQHS